METKGLMPASMDSSLVVKDQGLVIEDPGMGIAIPSLASMDQGSSVTNLSLSIRDRGHKGPMFSLHGLEC